jgi:phytoene dehydrogenase-like protein
LIPQGPTSLLRTRLLSLREKGRAIPALVRLPRMNTSRFAGLSADEAVAALGLGPTASELLRAMVRLSTYTAATDQLDGVSAIEQVQMGMTTGAIYLDGGWQSLVDQLEAAALAAGVAIIDSTPVQRVAQSADGTVKVTAAGDQVIDATTAVLATGGPDAAAALLGRPIAPAEALGPPALAACLELGLRRRPTHPFILGIDEPTYLATHCPPADLAPEGGAVVHVMRYLRADDDLASQAVRDQLRRLAARAGVQDDDIAEERFLAKMPVTGAIPTAQGGRQGRVPVMAADRLGILLAGDWVGAEGLLADAAVASGALAGRLAVERDATLAVA